jgi:gas vesicle protein
MRQDQDTSTPAVFMAFILGGLLGAGLAMLFAPESGSRLRDRIRDMAGDMRDRATDMAGTARDRAATMTKDLRDRAESAMESAAS